MPLFLVVAAAMAGAGWLWYDAHLAPDEEAGAKGGRGGPVAIEAVPVASATVRDVRTFPGTLFARTAFDVAAKVSGRLEQLNVDVGDIVERGMVVAQLDQGEQRELVQRARAELGVAKAAVAEARTMSQVNRSNLDRSIQLFKRGIIPEAQLETAKAEANAQEARVLVSEARVIQSEAALRAEEVRLDYTVIRADWNGEGQRRVVGQRYVTEGETLAANRPVISVLDLETVTAVVHATEADYALLKRGQPVALRADGFPGSTFPGTITRLSPRFEEGSRQARVEAEVPNAKGLLKPGMFVRVEVEVARAERAILVPAESVVNREGQIGVFMVDAKESIARFVPVRTGLVMDDRVQVIEPKLAGLVANLGQHLLRDGAKIRLVSSHDANRGGGANGAKPAASGNNQ